jgi:hypothetical protein
MIISLIKKNCILPLLAFWLMKLGHAHQPHFLRSFALFLCVATSPSISHQKWPERVQKADFLPHRGCTSFLSGKFTNRLTCSLMWRGECLNIVSRLEINCGECVCVVGLETAVSCLPVVCALLYGSEEALFSFAASSFKRS